MRDENLEENRVIITVNSAMAIVQDTVPGEKVRVFEYTLPEKIKDIKDYVLIFTPNYADHYILAKVPTVLNEYSGWDASLFIESKGRRISLWDGQYGELMDSIIYRQNGHPLVLNSEAAVAATFGDRLVLELQSPKPSEIIKAKECSIAIKCTLKRQVI